MSNQSGNIIHKQQMEEEHAVWRQLAFDLGYLYFQCFIEKTIVRNNIRWQASVDAGWRRVIPGTIKYDGSCIQPLSNASWLVNALRAKYV